MWEIFVGYKELALVRIWSEPGTVRVSCILHELFDEIDDVVMEMKWHWVSILGVTPKRHANSMFNSIADRSFIAFHTSIMIV